MAKSAEPTGFARPLEVPVQDNAPVRDRPLSQAWITDELIEKHRRLWSRKYRRIITEEEAIEIIMNIKRFAEAVLNIDREQAP